MQRDLNLVRQLLLRAESCHPANLETYSQDQINYHLKIMLNGGLLTWDGPPDSLLPFSSRAFDLTWAGHEFLDDVRDETIWRKAQEATKKIGGQVSVPVISEILKSLVRLSVGLA